jgi:hypothetical protein
MGDDTHSDACRAVTLTPTQQTVNRACRGMGTCRARRRTLEVLAHLPQIPCSPNRMSSISAAVLTLERER